MSGPVAPAAAAVVAGSGSSPKNELFVATVGSAPLFRKMRATVATLVPPPLNRSRESGLPLVASAVNTSRLFALTPVKSFAAAVMAWLIPVLLLVDRSPCLLKIGSLFPGMPGSLRLHHSARLRVLHADVGVVDLFRR